MSQRTAILLCGDPQSPKWQLRRPRGSRLLLIGWKESVQSADAGIPPWTTQLLARALTERYQVTFPSTVVRPGDAEVSTRLSVKGLWRRLASRGPRSFSLVTTRRPEVVVAAFDDPGFPWWMQAQVLLLSHGDAACPHMESDEVLALLESPAAQYVSLDSRGVGAQLRPGVDGDVAGLISDSDAAEQAFLTTLRQTAAADGVLIETTTETAFSDALAR